MSATHTPTHSATPSNRPAPSVLPGEEVDGPVAVLDSLGTFLTIEFDVNTNRAGKSGSFDCSEIVSTDIGNVFPEDGCSFSNRRTLEIELRRAQDDIDEFNTTVKVGSKITIRDGVIQRELPSAEMPKTTVEVTQPDPPEVHFFVDFNAVQSLCEDVDISVSSALGATRGGDLKWQWELIEIILNDGTNITEGSQAKDVRDAISEANENNDDELQIPEYDRPFGASYKISLSASNDAGKTHMEMIDFEVEGVTAPSIIFNRRPSRDEVDVSEAARYRTSTLLEFCENSEVNESEVSAFSFSFEWSIIRPDGELVDIEGFLSPDPRRLNIRSKRLLPFDDPYDIQFNVTATPEDGGEALRSSRDIPLTVEPSDVVARISGGDRSTGSESPLTLDASGSASAVEDLENLSELGQVNKSFNWTCKFLDEIGDDTDCNYHLLSGRDTEEKLTIPVDDLENLQNALDNPEELRIKFEVTVELILDRIEGDDFVSEDSDDVEITLKEGKVPDVSFDSIQPEDVPEIEIDGSDYYKVNRKDEIRLEAGVEDSEDVNVRGWEVIDGDISNLGDIVDGGDTSSRIITLLPDTLTRGVQYTLRFSASFNDSLLTGSTDVRLSVNRAPRGGRLRIRREGNDLGDDKVTSDIDEVQLQGRDWQDNDFPLEYEYFYSFTSSFSDSNLLRRRGSSRNYRTTIPTPPDGGDSVWIFLRVYDSLGARTRISRTVNIKEPDDPGLIDDFVERKIDEAQECERRADSECVAIASREASRAHAAASRLGNAQQRILSSEDSVSQRIVDVLEDALDTYVNEEDSALVYYESLRTSAGSGDLTTDLGEQIVRIVDTVLSKNFEDEDDQFRYSVDLGTEALTATSRVIAAGADANNSDVEKTEKMLNDTAVISVKLSRSVLLNRDPDGSTRTLQASFNGNEVFCDKTANIGVFTRLVSTGRDFTVTPDSQHGIGLSDKEFKNCDIDPEDTDDDSRAKPGIAGSEDLIDEVSSVIIVAEEFIEPPVVGDKSSDIAQAAESSDTATSLLQSLKNYVETDLLPDGNKIGDGLTVDYNRRLRSLGSKNRVLAEDVVSDDFSADAFDRSISSKPVRVSIFDTHGDSVSVEDGQYFEVTMALYPDSEANLTGFTSVSDIVEGRESFPSQTFECPMNEPRNKDITCDDPVSGTFTVTVTCDSSLAGSEVEFFCSTKLLIPVILHSDDGNGWSDAPINSNATKFDGRIITAESNEKGLFVSSFLAVETDHAAKMLQVAPSPSPASPSPSPEPEEDDAADDDDDFPAYAGVIVGVGLAVLIAIVGVVVWRRWRHNKERVADVTREDESEMPMMPTEY